MIYRYKNKTFDLNKVGYNTLHFNTSQLHFHYSRFMWDTSNCKLFHFIDIKSKPTNLQVSQIILHAPLSNNSLYKQVEQKETVNGNNLWKHILLLSTFVSHFSIVQSVYGKVYVRQ